MEYHSPHTKIITLFHKVYQYSFPYYKIVLPCIGELHESDLSVFDSSSSISFNCTDWVSIWESLVVVTILTVASNFRRRFCCFLLLPVISLCSFTNVGYGPFIGNSLWDLYSFRKQLVTSTNGVQFLLFFSGCFCCMHVAFILFRWIISFLFILALVLDLVFWLSILIEKTIHNKKLAQHYNICNNL